MIPPAKKSLTAGIVGAAVVMQSVSALLTAKQPIQ